MQNFVLNPQRYLMPLCLVSLLVCSMAANAKTIEEMEAEAIQQKQADNRAAEEIKRKEAERKAKEKEKADEEKKAKLDAEIKRKAKEKAAAEEKAKQDAETEAAAQAKEKVDAENTLKQEVNFDSKVTIDEKQSVGLVSEHHEIPSSMEDTKATNQLKQIVSPTLPAIPVPKPMIPEDFDEKFPPVALRYGYDFKFFINYSNKGASRQRIQGFEVNFIEPMDYNQSPEVPKFATTPELISKDYIINKGETGVKAITSTPYFIKATPSQRGSKNLEVIYRIRYSKETSSGVWGDEYIHKTYQPYEISWCGDGVVDIAPSKASWKSEPCDTAAEPWKSNGTCRISPTDGKECELIQQ